MGIVYEASDLALRRAVAVKVLSGKLFGNREALKRFEREARATAALNHPNIVALYDFGRIAGEGAYIVMERIHGKSWRSELGRCKTIEPGRLRSGSINF